MQQTAQSYKLCQSFSRANREILMPHEVAQGPLEKIGADFFNLESNNYLLIADYYSQFLIIRRMRSIMTNATTDVMKQVFREYGIPKIVMSGRGLVFIKGVQSICKLILL